MELRRFFRAIFPLVDPEGLEEQLFALYYLSKGVTYGDALGMNREEREWHLRRITKQKRDEVKAIKRGNK